MTPPANESKAYIQPSFENYPMLHELFDRQTSRYPDQPFFLYTEDDKPDDIVRISMLELNRASHRAATAFSLKFDSSESSSGYGDSAQARESVAFIAPSDTLVYAAAFFGVLRAGFVPFFMSPRLPTAAIVELIHKSGCTHIITTPTLNPLTDKVIADLHAANPGTESIRRDFIPPLDVLFPHLGKETTEHDSFKFEREIKECGVEETYLYMHSSGSSGIPKVVPQTRRALAGWADRVYYKHWVSLHPSVVLAVMPLPVFHAIGLLSIIVGPLVSDAVMAIYPPLVKTPQSIPYTPSPSSVIVHAKRTGCNHLLAPPSLIHEWAQNPEHVEYMKSMNAVLYAGGPLVPKIGNRLVERGVSLVCAYGSTEAGAVSTFEVTCRDIPDSWQYARIAANVKHRWIDQGDGTTSELQVLRTKDQTPTILNLESDEEGYATGDLMERHPLQPDLWKPVGRIDSVLVLSTSEKVVPEPLEAIIGAHPFVLGIVVFGRARPSPGILIDPRPGFLKDYSPESIADFKEKLWPLVQQANSQAPAYARIFKEMIMVTDPEKPLPRTAKGTIQAKAAFKVYEAECAWVRYEGTNTTQSSESSRPPGMRSLADRKEVERWLLAETQDLLSDRNIDATKDLFHQGFDSLHASFLRNRIIQTTSNKKQDAASLPLDVVYKNPTIRKLAAAISALVTQPSGNQRTDGVEAVRQAIEHYSQGLPRRAPSTASTSSGPFTVLLTGSTGNLGSHLLANLLEDSRVAKVYAHNRPSSGNKSLVERQQANLAAHGLSEELVKSEKVVFVEGDLAADKLGLASSVYYQLLNEVNLVVHNAWKSNFNLTLQSFAPFMAGSRNLIDFSLASNNASDLRFLFTSSVASIRSWKDPSLVPEESLSDHAVAVGGGYGESKYVVERVLQKSGLNSSTFRITQLCGGRKTGCWASDEWVPAVLRTGLSLGFLPSSEGLVSWVSLSDTARVLLDDALAQTFGGANVYNLEHPRSVPWDTVVGYLNTAVVREGITNSPLPLLPFDQWISKLEELSVSADAATPIQEMPALKILPFLKGVAAKSTLQPARLGDQSGFSINKIMDRSKTVSKMHPLQEEDAVSWVKYWAGIGFLKPCAV